MRVRAPDEIDGRADDVLERDDVALLGVLAREVEQGAHDLLDLEPGLLDQLEALQRLRPRLGLLQQELGQAEDREQRIVDLVRDAGRELADRGELPALDELLVEAALLRQVRDHAEQQRRLSLVAVDEMREHLDGQRTAVLAPVDLTDNRARLEAGELVLVGLPPGERRVEADDLVR